jgi:2-polyprenyl-6-methoxyphenol hydroxylase-like FAD-dependent oxidoreductase
MNPDVVLVGAGPVGLFTAIELKLHNPALRIKVLERNNEYSRHHILRVEEESLLNSLAYKQYSEVKQLKGFVPTSEIEATFLNIAQKIGIHIERGAKVTDANELLQQYPSAHSIIGADGAHSTIRKQLFDDKKIVDKNLQYIVEIKYGANGKTSRLPGTTYGPALGQVNHFISENVGKRKNGTTPVSLFVFVDENTYKEVRKHPNATLEDLQPESSAMASLLNSIQPWLSLRKVTLNEELLLDTLKINGVALDIYQSECFAKKIGTQNVYLAGDAAAAVPYFRALNAGLISATLLAKTIAQSNTPDLGELNKNLAALAQGEIDRAQKQDNLVNIGRGVNSFLSIISKIPTAAILTQKQQDAMLNARVERPNIFRRNPRTLIFWGAFIVLTGILLATLLPLYPVMWPAVVVGSIAASGVVVLLISLLATWILSSIHKIRDPITPLPAFPWESEMPESSSYRKLSHLKGFEKGVTSEDSNNPTLLTPESQDTTETTVTLDRFDNTPEHQVNAIRI